MIELQNISSPGEAHTFMAKHVVWFLENGFTRAVTQFRLEEKDGLAKKVLKQVIYNRCRAEIEEFTAGLSDVGNFFDVLKGNSDIFKQEFCHKPPTLTKEYFTTLYTVEYSDEGSNARIDEDETIYSWELFLQDIEERCIDISFGELLSFATGANHIPRRGFPKPIKIKFFSKAKRLPSASTRILEVYLPSGIAQPERFRDIMVMAIKPSFGFKKNKQNS